MDYQNNNITSSNEQIKCYCGHTDYCDCGPLKERKQETLEEAAEKYTDGNHLEFAYIQEIPAFKAGAKWQQERMYSEEDMKLAFVTGALTDLFNTWNISDEDMAKEKFVNWFEQFKK